MWCMCSWECLYNVYIFKTEIKFKEHSISQEKYLLVSLPNLISLVLFLFLPFSCEFNFIVDAYEKLVSTDLLYK